MMAQKKYVVVHGTKGGETGKAVLFTLSATRYPEYAKLNQEDPHGFPLAIWFPFSQLSEIHADSMLVNTWILEQKNLMEFVA